MDFGLDKILYSRKDIFFTRKIWYLNSTDK
jgi:hypothetical protein